MSDNGNGDFDPGRWHQEFDDLVSQLPYPLLKTRLKVQLREQLQSELGRSEGWTWRPLAEAYKPKAPRKYVVGGMFPIPSVVTGYGPPGSLKSMLFMDCCVCVACGKPWLAGLPGAENVNPFEVVQGPVLWLDIDNGLDRTERRLKAIGEAHGAPPDTPLLYMSFPSPSFVASNAESVQMAIDAVRSVGAVLVVVDNLGMVSGGADENSSEMLNVMAGLRQIAELGECAVVVIHHKSKGTRDRAGDSLRGHSSIEAALDLALLTEREGDDDTVTLRSTKTRDIPVKPFSALWTYEQDTSGELIRGRFFGLGRPEAEALSKQEQAELCIEKDGRDRMNQSELVELVKGETGVGRNTALAALKRLVDSGRWRTMPGERNAVLYERAN